MSLLFSMSLRCLRFGRSPLKTDSQKLLQSTLLTILVLFAARLIVLGLVRAARRVFALREEVKQRYPGLESAC